MNKYRQGVPDGLAAAAASGEWRASALVIARVERCLADAASIGSAAALRNLHDSMRDGSAQAWCDVARQLLQRGQPLFAAALLDIGLHQYLSDPQLRFWLAQALWEAGEVDRAEAELRGLLPGEMEADAGKLLAQLLRGQGRHNAAAACMAERARAVTGDPASALECIQFVRECHRQDLASELCADALMRNPADSQLRALAGQIAQELGHFEQAREHYLAALAQGIDLNAWYVLGSLASLQRYRDREHADFALFDAHLRDQTLSPRARGSILFALGKACDDVGAYADAAQAWRKANALTQGLVGWSSTAWRDFVRARVAALPPPSAGSTTGCVPIFVVGLPRTGTTLIAELLGRHPAVCNRGELPILEYLAQRLIGLGASRQPVHLREAAGIYLAHLRRDDAPVGYYVDKNPLNFRYLDYVAAMFPQARVIHCRRQARDTALSIWSQPFARDEYAFARDFGDIAAMAEGCEKLMAHWRQSLPLPIITVAYEQMVADPSATLAAVLPELGLAPYDPSMAKPDQPAAITSASLWQARQPVHKRSVGRWRNYAELLPELVHMFAEE